MSNTANTAHKKEITTNEFEEKLKQRNRTKKWADLELVELYTVTSVRLVHTKFGKFMVLSSPNNDEVWVLEHLKLKYYIMIPMPIHRFI